MYSCEYMTVISPNAIFTAENLHVSILHASVPHAQTHGPARAWNNAEEKYAKKIREGYILPHQTNSPAFHNFSIPPTSKTLSYVVNPINSLAFQTKTTFDWNLITTFPTPSADCLQSRELKNVEQEPRRVRGTVELFQGEREHILGFTFQNLL